MNSQDLEIKILANDKVIKENLLAEHGLCFWIKYGKEEYLFDTGQGLVLQHNAEELGIDLNNLAGIILSHGHYDHGGGLNKLVKKGFNCKVYAHPQASKNKYSKHDEELVDRGINITKEDVNFVSITSPLEVISGLWVTGEIPRTNDWEQIPKKYKIKLDDKVQQDYFQDDQAVFMETEQGVIVLLGCSHAGVVNTLEYIRELTSSPIQAIIGGMHLINADGDRISKTVEYLKDLNPELVMPLHCTGFVATEQLIEVLGPTVELGKLGSHIKF
ncbi:MBL fold metallo-hydrolase [Halanaerobaculum tunisiense]